MDKSTLFNVLILFLIFKKKISFIVPSSPAPPQKKNFITSELLLLPS
jgi:hypothetical protein